MIKKIDTTNALAHSIEDTTVLDTMYDDLLTAEIYKKYPVAKQLAILNKDKTDPERIAYEEYIAKCKKAITALLAK